MDNLPKESIGSTKRVRRRSLQTEESTFREYELRASNVLRRKSTAVPFGKLRAVENWRKVRTVITVMIQFIIILKDVKRFGTTVNTTGHLTEEGNEFTEVMSSCVLHPGKGWVKWWAIVTSALLVFTAFYTPYVVCFFPSDDQTSRILDICIDIWFFCDIVVTFFTAYEKKSGSWETSRRRIAIRYVKSWFIFDFIACIPFQEIDSGNTTRYNGLLRLVRLPRLYRLVRIFRLFKLLDNFSHLSILTRWIQELKIHSGILRLLRFSFMVVVIVHVAGCFWYFLASMNDFSPDTWIGKSGDVDKGQQNLYLISIYWVFTVITTVGFGDITPANSIEQVYAMFVMGFGIAFYAYTVSNISTILRSMDYRNSEFAARVSALTDFAAETSLPRDMRENVLKQLKHNHDANLSSRYNRDKLISELPASLRTEISVHLNKALVDKVAFLQNKDPGFVSFLVPKLKPAKYRIGEVIYQAGEYAAEVFFLLKGRVVYKDEDGVGFKTYIKGSYFGEIEIMRDSIRTCTSQVVSKTAELLVLSRDHFWETLNEFPSVASEMIEYAQNRSQRNAEAVKCARTELNRKTRKRILRRTNRKETVYNRKDLYWQQLKRQFSKVGLVERRRGSLSPKNVQDHSPKIHLSDTFSEAVIHAEESKSETPSPTVPIYSPDLGHRSLTSKHSFHQSLTNSRSESPSSTERTYLQVPSSKSLSKELQRKLYLPLPSIPSEEEIVFGASSRRKEKEVTKQAISPDVESILREFERSDASLHLSLSHSISLLTQACKSQADLEDRVEDLVKKFEM